MSYFPGPKRQESCPEKNPQICLKIQESLLTITAVYRQKDFSPSRDSACIGDDKLKQIKMLTDMPGHKQEFKPRIQIQSLSLSQGRKGTKGKGHRVLKWTQVKKQEE